MLWDISPIAFTLSFGTFHYPVYWYGLLFAASLFFGILIFRWVYHREQRPEDEVYDLAFYFMGGTVIGARLGHVLFYQPEFYFSHPGKILAVWEGGLASHGAVAGILIALWLFSLRATTPSFLWVADRIAMATPISGFLIRIGNFCNSEILGTPTDMPWGVIFARIDTLPRHPVQLYESFCYLVILLMQIHTYRRTGGQPEGYLLGRSFVLVFSVRFVLEFFKEGQADFEQGWAINMGQWLSIPPLVVGAYLMWRARRAEAATVASNSVGLG